MLNMGDDASVAFYNMGEILFLTAHMENSAAAITSNYQPYKNQSTTIFQSSFAHINII